MTDSARAGWQPQKPSGKESSVRLSLGVNTNFVPKCLTYGLSPPEMSMCRRLWSCAAFVFAVAEREEPTTACMSAFIDFSTNI